VNVGMPATIDLTVYRGDNWAQTFRLLEAPDMPVDLTGATVTAWAVNGRAPAHILQTTIDANPGEITITAPAGGLDAGHYTYDVEVADASSVVTTWIAGRLDVTQDITNG
jgi:hypothetical protein